MTPNGPFSLILVILVVSVVSAAIGQDPPPPGNGEVELVASPLIDGPDTYPEELLWELFQSVGVSLDWLGLAAKGAGILAVLVLSLLADFIARQVILRIIARIIKKTQTSWDDILLKRKVFTRLSRIAPALVCYLLFPVVFEDMPNLLPFLQNIALMYMLFIVILVVDSLLDALLEIYRRFEVSKRMPLKGLVQICKIVVYFIGIILLLSILTSRNPGYFLGGMTAMTAVIMLIFKDSILGFVAGIQLSTNKMVQRGDWIEMPQFGADGDVLDVALTTVKVQNWDKTVTTIPTYALISNSFKNWRGMSESGGRRIKRSIDIDMSSVKFCDEEMLGRFAKIQFIREYLDRKQEELREFNKDSKIDDSSLVNGRRLTNIGTFRAYIEAYVRNHPKINKDMTCLIRQLAASEHGLPIEVYVFSSDKVWANYEAIQADIFDHLLAVVAEFDLRVFQRPTGYDLQSIKS